VSFPDDARTQAPPEAAPAGYRQLRFSPPPGACVLLLVRHGESQRAYPDRPFPVTDGRADPELAPEGVRQADLVAERLASGPAIDAIFVTSLRRTAQTAAPLARRLGLEPRVERDLREVGLGEWEGGGLYRKNVAENHPLAQRMRAEERWDIIPGAEPSAALAARVRGAIERLAAAHPGQRVAVFTHGGVIGQALALASGSRPFAFIGADNGSVSELVITGPMWIVRGYNDTSHLGRAALGQPSPGQPPLG
jgi:2,3-bisphosphoglycerate-dependent phosphoglycerate mutase